MQIMFSDANLPTPCPACARCGKATRLVGIEPHPTFASTDLRTFVCTSCDELQTQNVLLEGAPLAAKSGKASALQ